MSALAYAYAIGYPYAYAITIAIADSNGIVKGIPRRRRPAPQMPDPSHIS